MEESHLDNALREDLETVRKLLPSSAYEKLRCSTRIWINKSISFGSIEEPTIGRACTYHPKGGIDWLRANGMRVDKCGSIEIYCARDYLASRVLWGTGGVLLHEMCHAFHDQHCPNGFENKLVRDAYNKAMVSGKYDAVAVHGQQGLNGLTKAYACTNCMEFFAELSVAYHWSQDGSTEYNKWFPHNREQLRAHDAATLAVLACLWDQAQEHTGG